MLSRLEIRLLGGFSVRWGERLVTGFESQKVRALLVYLACQGETALSREHLAGLLWPDEEAETARKNLRQALYNLRISLLKHRSAKVSPLISTHQTVQLHPAVNPWLDTLEFEKAVKLGWRGAGGLDPDQLTHAAELYRGDFLPGFFVKDSLAFETWLIAQQERLREQAVQVFQRLVEYHLGRGEYRLALGHARRLVEIDPLSEKAHRDLMRLYALSGRRAAALAQYRYLRSLLEQELGVEPLSETTALHDAIMAEDLPPTISSGLDDDKTVPFIPLIGRREPYRQLRESWEAARQGEVRLALVGGEAGIGKTRLVKSFVHHATSQRRAVVLQGRCYPLSPEIPLLPFSELLRNATQSEIYKDEKTPDVVYRDLPRTVLDLLPELTESRHSLGSRRQDKGALFDGVADFLGKLLPGDSRDADPLILLLDDLQWADRSSLELLVHLVEDFTQRPLWIAATWQAHRRSRREPELTALQSLDRVDRIDLTRLTADDVEEVATGLVGKGPADELAAFLEPRASGLPLAMTETVNALCDAGLLMPALENRWRLAGALETVALPHAADLEELLRWRVQRLPTSIARLLTMAAVIGHRFDSDLLEKAANEHPAVVETALQTLLDRWLIRHSPHYWEEPTRRSDRSLWSEGVRGGIYEFGHHRIREAVYRSINPLRRQSMHGRVALMLEQSHADKPESVCEALAYHYTLAGEKALAVPYLKMAAERAKALLALDTATAYQDQALEIIRQLEKTSDTAREKQRWRSERKVLVSLVES